MKLALLGLAFATAAFPWVFRSRRGNFWARMALVAGSLGLLGVFARILPSPSRQLAADLASGIASAALLYGIFQVGDRLTRRLLPFGGAEIAKIYRLRAIAPRWLIGLLLVAVIAPSEESFWRGLLQRALSRRLGVGRGAVVAALGYAGVHLAAGNLTLTGAAGVAGLVWSIQYALQRRLLPVIVSHVVWDVWIFLVAPTPGGKS